MNNPDHSLHHATPTVAVRDNRGLAVRQVVYHRHPGTPDDIDERITRHQFDAFGHPVESVDPRLHTPNFTYHLSMTGETLRTVSVDAGLSIALNDIARRPLMHLSANDVTRYHHYEPAPLAGRPLSVTESFAGATPRIAERFVWAGTDQASKEHNLAGLLVRHYDTAGRLETDSVALTGLPLSSTRQLLATDGETDWQGADETAWEKLLAAEAYTTLARADATGTLLAQTDARKHVQRLVHDIAGQLASSWLTLNGGAEQAILRSVAYSAAGQKLREEHGNGVVTTFTYEPRTQRLLHILVVRPTDGKRLQDLRYAYDPVGNVIHLHNDAEATRFYRNQKVVPEHYYTYDTLYQLASATGRELLDIAKRQQNKQPFTLPLPSTDGTLVNYVRHYHYDRGGNLTLLQHNPQDPPNAYTIELTVSDRSNRAVDKKVTEDPAQVDTYFDAAGNQRQLQATQQLGWTARGELARAVLIARNVLAADEETYRYDASSQRMAKQRTDQTSGTLRRNQVLYLPGLELRTQYSDATVESSRHEIIVGAAGSAQVRVLHWETGLPPGMANDTIRYSHTDLIGSVGLELDKEANLISQEEYYPYGETAVWLPHNTVEADYKTVRYSGKERDATGLYYYGYRYYQPWLGRWLSADPAGTVDGLNLYQMVRSNPTSLKDQHGLNGGKLTRNTMTLEEAPRRKKRDTLGTFVSRGFDKIKGAVIERPDREGMMNYFNAAVAARGATAAAEEELGSFMDSKRLHIVTRATLAVLTELLASAYSNLASLATAPVGGIASTVAGSVTKEAVKKAVGAPSPRPDTNIAKYLSEAARPGAEKVKDEIRKQLTLDKIKDKFTDKGDNETVKFAAEKTGHEGYLPSIPFSGLQKNAKAVDSAISTGKDALLEEALDNVNSVIELAGNYQALFNTAFENISSPVNYDPQSDGWKIVSDAEHKYGERAIPTTKHGRPFMLTQSTVNAEFSMLFAQLGQMKNTITRRMAQRSSN